MSNKLTVTLKHKKTTKGTYVYGNEDQGLSLYFPQDLEVFKGAAEPPKTLSMTLEVK